MASQYSFDGFFLLECVVEELCGEIEVCRFILIKKTLIMLSVVVIGGNLRVRPFPRVTDGRIRPALVVDVPFNMATFTRKRKFQAFALHWS